jgi:hypothetical protein
LVLFVASSLAGCIESAGVPCGEGVCAPGTTCEPTTGRCISDAQRAACDGRVEGDSCSVDGALGACVGGACATFSCGDGRRGGTERCDGSDLGGATCESLGYHGATTGLACTSDCLFDVTGCERTCGDGVADPEEQCDGADLGTAANCTSLGFYEPAGLTCTPSCTWDFARCLGFCGDGLLNGPEVCDGAPPPESCVDFGLDAGPAGCSASCGVSFAQCARLSWRRELVNPVGLYAVRLAADGAWAAGPNGYIARQVLGGWQQTPTPTTEPIAALWTEGTRAWAVAVDGTLLIWDGTSWQPAPSGPNAPSGIAANVWATGSTAFVLTRDAGVRAWDGASWHAVGALGCTFAVSIAGTSPTDLWVGCGGATTGTAPGLYHWDGAAWTLARANATVAVGVRGTTIVRSFWSPAGIPMLETRTQGTWTAVALYAQCSSLEVIAANNIWCGASDSLLHYDGMRLAATDPLPYNASGVGNVVGVSSIDGGSVLAATSDGNVYRNRGHLMVETPTGPIGAWALGVWSDPRDERFVVTQNGRASSQRADWNDGWSSSTLVSSQPLRAIWGASRTEVWAGGLDGMLYRFNGTTWSATGQTFGPIRALFGVRASDVWLLGDVPYHYDGTAWEARPNGALVAPAVGAAAGPDAAWIATNEPLALYRWTNGAWEVARPLTDAATSISAVGSDLAFVAMNRREVLRFDSGTWDTLAIPSAGTIASVLAFARDDVFVASNKEILHFDGTRWSPIRLELGQLEDIITLHGRRGRVEILSSSTTAFRIRSILRVAPWVCRASEVECGDGVDDDCDGAIDGDDGDCP